MLSETECVFKGRGRGGEALRERERKRAEETERTMPCQAMRSIKSYMAEKCVLWLARCVCYSQNRSKHSTANESESTGNSNNPKRKIIYTPCTYVYANECTCSHTDAQTQAHTQGDTEKKWWWWCWWRRRRLERRGAQREQASERVSVKHIEKR